MRTDQEKEESAERVSLTVRLPPKLHERLVDLAAREHRSLNGQVLFMLELSLRTAYVVTIPAEEPR